VCTGNQDRSPTTEALLKGEEGIQVKSAGTCPTNTSRSRLLTKDLIEWADEIYAMEEEHRKEIARINPEAKAKTVVLGIEDIYQRGTPELVRILGEKLERYFEKVL
jgi:predicted protein tyrosine phosphatase